MIRIASALRISRANLRRPPSCFGAAMLTHQQLSAITNAAALFLCACAPSTVQILAEVNAPAHGDANRALLEERYCRPMAALAARAVDACQCDEEAITSGFLSPDELLASCEYHLLVGIPDDHALRVDEAAVATCMALLDRALTGCVTARLPVECELDRLFGPMADALALSRPAGADCRATNGDEGFDANFLCAPGLRCGGTCVPVRLRGDASEREVCRNPLDLPGAFP